MVYAGKAYQAPSGQWSWVITEDDLDIVRGAGYDDQDEALQAMYEDMENHKQRGGAVRESMGQG